MQKVLGGVVAAVLLLSGCSMKNGYEKEADKITGAVVANNVDSVRGDFDSVAQAQMTRANVGRLSDELNSQGKFLGVKETTPQGSPAGTHTFDAPFEKLEYVETLVYDGDGKVHSWHIQPKAATR